MNLSLLLLLFFKLDIYNTFFFGSIICVTIFGVFSCELLLVGFVVSHDEWKRLQEFGIWSPEDKDKPISIRPSWRPYPEIFFFFFLSICLLFNFSSHSSHHLLLLYLFIWWLARRYDRQVYYWTAHFSFLELYCWIGP